MTKETQENLGEPNPDTQDLIELRGEKVWIDKELVPLIREMNKAGLITRSCCSGHDVQNAWVIVRLDTITHISITTEPPYNEVRLCWEREGK